MKKVIGLFIIAVIVFSLSFCASAPEEEPEAVTEVTEEPKEEPVKEPAPEPVSEEIIQAARDAIARAEAAEAPMYASDLFSEATTSFDDAMDIVESDPDNSRELFITAKEKADEAFDISVNALSDKYAAQFKEYERKLLDLEADTTYPEKSNELYNKAGNALDMFGKADLADARNNADALLMELKNFYEQLISENDVRLAQEALDRAEEAQARIYAPDLFSEATNAFEEAMDILKSDSDRARELLAMAKQKADEAFDTAVYALFDNYTLKFKQYERKLKEIEADKFRPNETNDLYTKVEQAVDLFQQDNFRLAKQTADLLLKELQEFYEKLDEEIRWANILKRDTEMYLDDAEDVQAYIWAPEDLENSVTYYTLGLEAFRSYQLDESIAYLSDAKGYGLKAVRVSPQRKAEYRTNALQKEIEQDIQEASEMTIITEDGTIIGPDSGTNEKDNGDKQQSFKLPIDEKTAVLGDVSAQTLLEQARELYTLGVTEKESGNYSKANEYFREAGRLIYQYKSMAVGKSKVIEVYNKNTLWFIADHEWDNSFFWPLIWEYNQETIRDPDLIFPGETIFIPAR